MSGGTVRKDVMRRKVELLAPAGSVETLYAAYAAGADAAYIGGSRFGARAFADNADQDQLLEAIDYAHLHGKKLYLTVNTLLKEEELMQGLYAYLLPFYCQGLDAVIVQDLGVLRKIREWFPDLAVHASTQMAVTGALTAARLQELGVARLVTPRELSLQEIRQIRQSCDLEIESFVHGALCYCFSGQCLFSSIAGGRSGNRGRCAQPCRMAYSVAGQGKVIVSPEQGYVLSPKDLCTIELLPQLLETGIDSLKIEGRMKKPEYTAGVVRIYRKYLDLYLAGQVSRWRVSEEDRKHLLGLFNRKGFTDGYYTRHNGASMITRTAPDFRAGEEAFLEELRRDCIGKKLKENIKGTVKICQGKPAILSVSLADGTKEVSVSAGEVRKAKNQPLSEEAIRRQLDKLSDTDFAWEKLTVETDLDSFCPVGVLNELRRSTAAKLKEELLAVYRRKERRPLRQEEMPSADAWKKKKRLPIWHAAVETGEQLNQVLAQDWIGQVTIDAHLCEEEAYADLAGRVHAAGKSCWLRLAQMFRQENEKRYLQKQQLIREAAFDGILAPVAEAWMFAQKYLLPGRVAADHSLYAWNRAAAEELSSWGCVYRTLPVELNRRELAEIADPDSELIVYGRLPMMVSAQCICRTVSGCTKKLQELTLIDRMGNRFPVKNNCRECFNVIYNSLPLSLEDQWKSVSELPVRGYRLSFTTEGIQETKQVLDVYRDLAVSGKTQKKLEHTTRGHYKRGAE